MKKAKGINPKITRNNVSDILRELREMDLVTCLNPSEKKGRLYRLTKKGAEIQTQI